MGQIYSAISFWHISNPLDYSWIWRKILKLRPMVLQFLSYRVGNGNLFSLWHDPWMHGQALNPSTSLLSDSRIPVNACIADIISMGAWALPSSNHHEVQQFCSLFSSLPNPSDAEDLILWDNRELKSVKTSIIWKFIHLRAPKVPWANLLWESFHVP